MAQFRTNPFFTHNFLFRVVVSVVIIASAHPATSLSPVDLNALIEIKRNLQELPGSNFLSTWDFSKDPCTSFTGIRCSPDPNGSVDLRVQSLTLGTGLMDTPGLAGKLSPAIAKLTYLTQFVAYAGNISGPIPLELGSLERLQLLSITKNRISGGIPLSLMNLKSLHTLDLGYNLLQGSVPRSLTALPGLKVLILASNLFSGRVPDILAPQLFHLDLRRNLFWGQLPLLPSTLRYLSVAQNRISGPITNLGSLSDLGFLDLSMNRFSGEIPRFLFGYSLSSLFLQRNYFSGQMPAAEISSGISGVGSTVDLSHNSLSGEITTVLTGVENLYLNNNRFTGLVPPEYVNKVYGRMMKTLYLQHNYLTGIPVPLGAPPPESAELCISYNCMVPPIKLSCPASAGRQQSRPVNQCQVFNATTV